MLVGVRSAVYFLSCLMLFFTSIWLSAYSASAFVFAKLVLQMCNTVSMLIHFLCCHVLLASVSIHASSQVSLICCHLLSTVSVHFISASGSCKGSTSSSCKFVRSWYLFQRKSWHSALMSWSWSQSTFYLWPVFNAEVLNSFSLRQHFPIARLLSDARSSDHV